MFTVWTRMTRLASPSVWLCQRHVWTDRDDWQSEKLSFCSVCRWYVQWMLWMTDREPCLQSHTPAIWGTAWSLTFPVTWCRRCFIFLRVPAEKSLKCVHLLGLAWPTSSKKQTKLTQTEVAHRLNFRVCSVWMLDSDVNLWWKQGCIKS